jgi:hypothetical protein
VGPGCGGPHTISSSPGGAIHTRTEQHSGRQPRSSLPEKGGDASPPLCRGERGLPLALPHCSAVLSVFVLSTGLTDTRYNVEFSNRAGGELTTPLPPNTLSAPHLCNRRLPPPWSIPLRQPNCQLPTKVFGRSRKLKFCWIAFCTIKSPSCAQVMSIGMCLFH